MMQEIVVIFVAVYFPIKTLEDMPICAAELLIGGNIGNVCNFVENQPWWSKGWAFECEVKSDNPFNFLNDSVCIVESPGIDSKLRYIVNIHFNNISKFVYC